MTRELSNLIQLVVVPTIIDGETFKIKSEIRFREKVYEIQEMMCDLKEKAIHDGLIALGWKPPEKE